MEIKSKFDHFNINVTNLERSIAFYEKAMKKPWASRKTTAKKQPMARSPWSI